jgi:type II secretory pathway pseudopilin PulG
MKTHTTSIFRPPVRRGLTLLELVLVLVILTALGSVIIPMTEGIGEDSRATVTRSVLRDLAETLTNRYHQDMHGFLVTDDGTPLPGLPFPDPLRFADHGRNINHPQLTFLFVNPQTFEDGLTATLDSDRSYSAAARRGWNGPYVQHNGGRFRPAEQQLHVSFTPDEFETRYGVLNDPVLLDGWGRPVVLQVPVLNDDVPLAVRWRHARLVSAGPSGIIHTPPDVLIPDVSQRGDDFVVFLSVADTGLIDE